MTSRRHQILLNALANELDKEGVKIRYLDRDGMREPFDIQYHWLSEPPSKDGKTPDLQGEDGWGIHIGEADVSASDSQTQDQLRTFVRYVMNHRAVLHVAVPVEHADSIRNTILGVGWKRKIESEIWVWSFRYIGQACFFADRQRVR